MIPKSLPAREAWRGPAFGRDQALTRNLIFNLAKLASGRSVTIARHAELILAGNRTATREPFPLTLLGGCGLTRVNLPRQVLCAARAMPLRCARKGTT